MTINLIEQFSIPLLQWFDQYGRKDLPWQHPRTAYRVWVSEIMLQQTQVKTVIPYFNRFMNHFPTIWELAQAEEDTILAYWAGLGYYSRARNLHKTSKIICDQYQGEFPTELSMLVRLPGIGPSTAAAITAQAFDQPTAILDGNVQRVLCRYFQVEGTLQTHATKQRLWKLAKQCMPQFRCADYTQALMDLGATCCIPKSPQCNKCPLHNNCLAHQKDKTNDYPQKKPTKIIPIRYAQFLLIHTERKLYLEKRPPTGVWGGLWCLPHVDTLNCAQTYAEEKYSISCIKAEDLLIITHRLTHFQWHINAVALQINIIPNASCNANGKWFEFFETEKLALPKPVQDIIHYFSQRLSLGG